MKMSFKKWLDKGMRFADKNLPTILTAIGITGMITCAVETGRATYNAMLTINEKSVREHRDDFTKKEVVQATWKHYIAPVGIGVVSTACLIGGNTVNTKRSTALAAAYNVSEKALRSYKEQTLSTVGPKKEQEIRTAIAKQAIDDNPIDDKTVYITGSGNTLCFDPITARYFKSDIETIRRAVNDLNERLLREDYVGLNDLYYALDLEESKIGYNLGWSVEKGQIQMSYSSHLAPNGEPCIVMSYDVNPKWSNY